MKLQEIFTSYKHYIIEIGEDPEGKSRECYLIKNKETNVIEVAGSVLAETLHYAKHLDESLEGVLNEFDDPQKILNFIKPDTIQ